MESNLGWMLNVGGVRVWSVLGPTRHGPMLLSGRSMPGGSTCRLAWRNALGLWLRQGVPDEAE